MQSVDSNPKTEALFLFPELRSCCYSPQGNAAAHNKGMTLHETLNITPDVRGVRLRLYTSFETHA